MTEDEKAAIDQVANALQAALLLAERVRRNAGDQADDAVKLEAATDRAVRALKRLQPKSDTGTR
jgi:hypothetical protein